MHEAGTQPEGSTGRSEAPTRWRAFLGTLLPWIVAGGALAWIFARVPLAEAWTAARAARLDLFGAIMIGGVVVWFLIESTLYAHLFTRFNAPVSRAEARALRGLSYALTAIHYNVAKAAVVLRLRQTKRVPILEGTSTLLFYQSADGVILALFAGAGLALLSGLGEDTTDFAEAGTAAGVMFGLTLANVVLLRANRPRFRALDWWRGLAIHRTHRRFAVRDFATVLIGKSVYHFLFVLVFWSGLRAFDVPLPFALVLAATPIIQIVGALPISPAGLGTQQAAMLHFFGAGAVGTLGASGVAGDPGLDARVVAFGFSFPVALIGLRCVLGLFYLKDLRAIRRPGGAAQPATSEAT